MSDFDEFEDDFGLDNDYDDAYGESGEERTPSSIAIDIGNGIRDSVLDDKMEAAKEVGESFLNGMTNNSLVAGSELASDVEDSLEDAKRKVGESMSPLLDTIPREEGGVLDEYVNKAKSFLGIEDAEEEEGEEKRDLAVEASNAFAEGLIQQNIDADRLARIQTSLMSESTKAYLEEAINTQIIISNGLSNSSKYHKYSIELKYKHLLETIRTNEYVKMLHSHSIPLLEAIVKNSSLPDIVKARSSEAFSANAKAELTRDLVSKIAGSGMSERIKANILGKVRSTGEFISSTLDGANSMASSVGDGVDAKTAGNMAGSMGLGFAGGKLANLFGKTKIGSKVKGKFDSLDNPEVVLSKMSERDDRVGKFFSFIKDLAGSVDTSPDSLDLTRDGNELTSFDKRTHNSINKVIPTILGNILGEVKFLNGLGRDTTFYDYKSDSFINQDDKENVVREDLSTQMDSGGFVDKIRSVIEDIGKVNEGMSREDKEVLAKFILDSSYNNDIIDLNDIDSMSLPDGMDKEQSDRIKTSLKNFSSKKLEDGEIVEDTDSNMDKQSRLLNVNDTVNATAFLKQKIDDGHSDTLESLGILTYDKPNGRYVIDNEKYSDLIRGEISLLAVSDKKDILTKKESLDKEALRLAKGEVTLEELELSEKDEKIVKNKSSLITKVGDTISSIDNSIVKGSDKIFDLAADGVDKVKDITGKKKLTIKDEEPTSYIKVDDVETISRDKTVEDFESVHSDNKHTENFEYIKDSSPITKEHIVEKEEHTKENVKETKQSSAWFKNVNRYVEESIKENVKPTEKHTEPKKVSPIDIAVEAVREVISKTYNATEAEDVLNSNKVVKSKTVEELSQDFKVGNEIGQTIDRVDDEHKSNERKDKFNFIKDYSIKLSTVGSLIKGGMSIDSIKELYKSGYKGDEIKGETVVEDGEFKEKKEPQVIIDKDLEKEKTISEQISLVWENLLTQSKPQVDLTQSKPQVDLTQRERQVDLAKGNKEVGKEETKQFKDENDDGYRANSWQERFYTTDKEKAIEESKGKTSDPKDKDSKGGKGLLGTIMGMLFGGGKLIAGASIGLIGTFVTKLLGGLGMGTVKGIFSLLTKTVPVIISTLSTIAMGVVGATTGLGKLGLKGLGRGAKGMGSKAMSYVSKLAKSGKGKLGLLAAAGYGAYTMFGGEDESVENSKKTEIMNAIKTIKDNGLTNEDAIEYLSGQGISRKESEIFLKEYEDKESDMGALGMGLSGAATITAGAYAHNKLKGNKSLKEDIKANKDIRTKSEKAKSSSSVKKMDKSIKSSVKAMKPTAVAKGVMSHITKSGGTVTPALKVGVKAAAKSVPFVGSALSLSDAYSEVKDGDYGSAALSVLNAALMAFPPTAVIGAVAGVGKGLYDGFIKEDDKLDPKPSPANIPNVNSLNSVNSITDKLELTDEEKEIDNLGGDFKDIKPIPSTSRDGTPRGRRIRRSSASKTFTPSSKDLDFQGKEYSSTDVSLLSTKGVSMTMKITGYDKLLLEQIAKHESRKGNAGYDVAFAMGKYLPKSTKKLTKYPIKTIFKLMKYQVKSTKANGSKYITSAMGKYQFMQNTLRELVKQTGISTDTLFNKQAQDYLILERLKRKRKYSEWQKGEVDNKEFLHELSKEFASIEDPNKGNGKGFYKNQKAHNKKEVFYLVLDKMKELMNGKESKSKSKDDKETTDTPTKSSPSSRRQGVKTSESVNVKTTAGSIVNASEDNNSIIESNDNSQSSSESANNNTKAIDEPAIDSTSSTKFSKTTLNSSTIKGKPTINDNTGDDINNVKITPSLISDETMRQKIGLSNDAVSAVSGVMSVDKTNDSIKELRVANTHLQNLNISNRDILNVLNDMMNEKIKEREQGISNKNKEQAIISDQSVKDRVESNTPSKERPAIKHAQATSLNVGSKYL